jgi:pyridoxal 5'-phosphate synthase pdxS subunit
MIRTKGEEGTGNVVEAVRHMRTMNEEIAALKKMNEKALKDFAKKERVGIEIVKKTRDLQRLTVVNFAAGGIATPADAALMMQLGCDGVFVGSGIFKSSNPPARAKAVVEATLHFRDAAILAKCSEGLGEAMESLEISKIQDKYAERGW